MVAAGTRNEQWRAIGRRVGRENRGWFGVVLIQIDSELVWSAFVAPSEATVAAGQENSEKPVSGRQGEWRGRSGGSRWGCTQRPGCNPLQ